MQALFLTGVLSLLGASPSSTTTGPLDAAVASDREHAGSRRVHAAYFYVDGETRANLRLVNQVCVPDVVRVLLRLGGVVPVELGVYTVPSSGFLDVPIGPLREISAAGTWGDGSRPGSLWGSIEVETASSIGWVETLAAEKSLVLGSELGMIRPAARIAALWWRPTAQTRAHVALQNHADAPVAVREERLAGDAWSVTGTLTLGARQARLLELPAELPPLGAVRYTADGGQPVLTATAILIDEARGFSAHFPLRNAALTHEVRHLAGLPAGASDTGLGFPAGLHFDPLLLVANPAAETARVEVAISDGAGVRTHLDLMLGPGERRELDLGAAIGTPLPSGHLGLSIRSTRPEVLYEAVSLSRTGADAFRYSFHSPFEGPRVPDHGPGPGSGGPVRSEPSSARPGFVSLQFDVRGDRNTHVVLRNLSDGTQSGVVYFADNEDGDFLDNPVGFVVAPRATRVLDVRVLQRASAHAGGAERFDAETGYVVVSGDLEALEVAVPVFDPLRGTCIEGSDSGVCVECNATGGDCRLVAKYPDY